MMTWTHGRHFVKFGAGYPTSAAAPSTTTPTRWAVTHSDPRSPPTASRFSTSALENYAGQPPSGYSQNSGDVHFIYHQQEMGAFIQDQFKITDRFSVTPGLRYDWQNFFAQKRLGFSPRVSFAWVLDEDSKTVLRGGGGIYYDRTGSGSLLDLVRYQGAEPRRRAVTLSLDPATQPAHGLRSHHALRRRRRVAGGAGRSSTPTPGCPIRSSTASPSSASWARKPPPSSASTQRAASAPSAPSTSTRPRRSPATPTPQPGLRPRPRDAAGRLLGRQRHGHLLPRPPQQVLHRLRPLHLVPLRVQYRRHRLVPREPVQPRVGVVQRQLRSPPAPRHVRHVQSRKRVQPFRGHLCQHGPPWSDPHRHGPLRRQLFSTPGPTAARNTETMPSYVDLDLRWGHDFAITPNKDEEAPRLGFSAGAFNILNHENPASIDQVVTSSGFGEVTAVNPARRIQLGMRFEF